MSGHAVETTAFYGPVTALHWLTDSLLLGGCGGTLLTYRLDDLDDSFSVVNKDRIHYVTSLTAASEREGQERWTCLLCAGRQFLKVNLVYACNKFTLENVSKSMLSDWLLSAAFFKDQDNEVQEALVLSSHNSIYRLNLETLEVLTTIDCSQRPLLWSATFSQNLYTNLSTVTIAVGTILQEVLVWRPFESNETLKCFSGHAVGYSLPLPYFIFSASTKPYNPCALDTAGLGVQRCLFTRHDTTRQRLRRSQCQSMGSGDRLLQDTLGAFGEGMARGVVE